MLRSLVGSEMCIRDSMNGVFVSDLVGAVLFHNIPDEWSPVAGELTLPWFPMVVLRCGPVVARFFRPARVECLVHPFGDSLGLAETLERRVVVVMPFPREEGVVPGFAEDFRPELRLGRFFDCDRAPGIRPLVEVCLLYTSPSP